VAIRHIFETHLHADFVSGHRELASRTGARIYIGVQAEATFPHVAVEDGFQLQVGKMRITALETPGHTPESMCLVITRRREISRTLGRSDRRYAVSGRRRPSRSFQALQPGSQLAGMLYDSLHNKLLKPSPDEVLVCPAHGAGSLFVDAICARSAFRRSAPSG
jgi:hydroxyacylglutathione hydrolase